MEMNNKFLNNSKNGSYGSTMDHSYPGQPAELNKNSTLDFEKGLIAVNEEIIDGSGKLFEENEKKSRHEKNDLNYSDSDRGNWSCTGAAIHYIL